MRRFESLTDKSFATNVIKQRARGSEDKNITLDFDNFSFHAKDFNQVNK